MKTIVHRGDILVAQAKTVARQDKTLVPWEFEISKYESICCLENSNI